MKLLLIAALAISFATAAEDPGAAHFKDWPEGASPAVVGKRIAENFLPRKFRYETNPAKAHLGVIYPEVIAWYGSLTVADLIKDADLRDRLISKFKPLLTEPGLQRINRVAHVDYRVLGAVPLEIYLQTKDPAYKELGLSLADAQWENPTPDGVTAEARYWIDDMYMIPLVQVQAFRATGESKYLDRAALAMTSYLEKLQEPNGLFHHGTDSPFFWGRGNGWMAAGMTELLRALPEKHTDRPAILDGYRKMMTTLRETQGSDGMWRQLVDDPTSWPETSCTAMFTFAFITGVKNGWLAEADYAPRARQAWIALTGYLDENADIREVCVGTNKLDSRQYYLDRPRATGDMHGQAPVLWCASAFLR